MSIKLNNKIVLITGASSGIGSACAECFANEGANLIIAARRLNRLMELNDIGPIYSKRITI